MARGRASPSYDTLVSQPTRAAEIAQRKELEQVLSRIQREAPRKPGPRFARISTS